MLEVANGTAESITEAILAYFTSKAINGTAESITEAILAYFTSKAIHICRLVGMATDGASVMVACQDGVVTRIKALVPTLVATHCSAHRLSLAACEASSKRFEKILNQTYTFSSRSSVRTAELQEMQTVLEEPHLKLQRPTETRWLSHQNVIDALRRSFKAVHTTLEQEAADGEATAYYGLH